MYMQIRLVVSSKGNVFFLAPEIMCKTDMDDDDGSKQKGEGEAPEYDIVAVVKRKVLFSKRPMPIMASSATRTQAEGSGN